MNIAPIVEMEHIQLRRYNASRRNSWQQNSKLQHYYAFKKPPTGPVYAQHDLTFPNLITSPALDSYHVPFSSLGLVASLPSQIKHRFPPFAFLPSWAHAPCRLTKPNGEAFPRLVPVIASTWPVHPVESMQTDTCTLHLHTHTQTHAHAGSAVFSLTATVPNILSMYPNYFHVLSIIGPSHHHHASALPTLPTIPSSPQTDKCPQHHVIHQQIRPNCENQKPMRKKKKMQSET